MAETENPVIHITGTVSEKDIKAAIRTMGLRAFWRYAVILLGFIILMLFFMILYEWKTSDISLYYTFGEWLEICGLSLLEKRWFLGCYACLLVLYALYLLILRPNSAVKRLRELSPGGIPVTYDFYEDQVVWMTKTEKTDEVLRIKYADVQRKIIETKYHIIISTGQRNRLSFYKTIMTPEETIHVMTLLKERCPLRKK